MMRTDATEQETAAAGRRRAAVAPHQFHTHTATRCCCCCSSVPATTSSTQLRIARRSLHSSTAVRAAAKAKKAPTAAPGASAVAPEGERCPARLEGSGAHLGGGGGGRADASPKATAAPIHATRAISPCWRQHVGRPGEPVHSPAGEAHHPHAQPSSSLPQPSLQPQRTCMT